ncbi:MAG: hypothetical protein ACFWTM_04895 [Mitsuokella multacida]
MNIRERTEALEYEYLAPQAAKSREARRRQPVEECALRTKFQREERWGREQIVADYVAGLTDSYAVQLFSEIFIPPVFRR